MKSPPEGPRLVLAMIVKDEAPVIARCLASVKPFVDAWVVVDTGSSDATTAIVRDALAGVPGTLEQRPWRDFASNRNEALAIARGLGEFALVLDADETFEAPSRAAWPALAADAYWVAIELAGSHRFQRLQVFRNDGRARYEGVLHEALVVPDDAATTELPGALIRSHADSARNRLGAREKYTRDALLLEKAWGDGGAPRDAFYAGLSWLWAGEAARARPWLERRVALGGWWEEVYQCRLALARLDVAAGDASAALAQLAEAAKLAPRRVEAWYEAAQIHRAAQHWPYASLFAQRAAALPPPAPGDARLWHDPALARWRAHDLVGIVAFYAGDIEAGRRACDAALAAPDLPAEDRARILRNREWYER